MNLKDSLWHAYIAGWEASGEGWNGEYPGSTHPEDLGLAAAELSEKFEKWYDEGDYDD